VFYNRLTGGLLVVLKIEDKILRDKVYGIRVTSEEFHMIRYIMDVAKKDLPSMIRKGIKEVYSDITSRGVDDDVYSLD
jgi:hypothetical protein